MSKQIPIKDVSYSIDVPIEQILAWEGNPTARTSEKAIQALLLAVKESKTITEIVGINNNNNTVTLADGHRRFMVAKLLGFRSLMVRVFPDWNEPKKLYVILNSGTRSQSATDFLEAYILGDALPSNKNLATKIKFCVKLCGGSKAETKRIMLDGDKKISPGIVSDLQTAVSIIDGPAKMNGTSTVITETHKQVFYWIIKHGNSKLHNLMYTPIITPAKKKKFITQAVKSDTDLNI